MKNISKISVVVRGIEVQVVDEPVTLFKIAEINQSVDTDDNMDLNEMKQQQTIVDKVPEILGNICNVIHGQVDAFIATANKISANNKAEYILDIQHRKTIDRMNNPEKPV